MSNESLATVTVSLAGPENATLTEDDFVYDPENGTYTATYNGSSDGTYTATLQTAEDEAGNDAAEGQQDTADIDTSTDDGGDGGSTATPTPTATATPSPTSTATSTPPTTSTGTPSSDNDSQESCELFGLDFGSFIICWYWWLLAAIVGLFLAVYHIWNRNMLGQLLKTSNGEVGGDDNE